MSTAKALSRKRIVLLDDSVEFRDDFLSSQNQLPPEAQATYEFEAPDCYDPQTFESLVDAPPDFLVIDWTVGSENGAIDWLRALSKREAIDRIERVLLVGGDPFDIVLSTSVFDYFRSVSRVYLPKGFHVGTLLDVLTDPESTTGEPREYKPQDGEPALYDATDLQTGALASLPARRLDSQLKAVRRNRSWKLDVDEPVRFSEEERQRLGRGEPVTQVLRGLKPGNPETFNWYFLATWRDGESYLQVALDLPEHWQSRGAESTIEDVLTMMREAGFIRGRYYAINRVPGVEGRVLELVAANYSTARERPIARPLDGLLAERVADYERYSAEKGKLTYTIRTRHEDLDLPNDSAIQFWNQVIEADFAASWLEVPIYCRKTDRAEPAPQLMGWLIFDRVGAQTSPDQVSDFHVKAVKARLLSALDYLAKTRQTDHERAQRSQYRQLQTYVEALSRAKAKGEIEQATVGALKEITGADSVVLAVNDPGAKLLRVSKESEPLLTGLAFPYRLDRFLMVKCVTDAKPVYRPDYDDTPKEERITEDDWLQVHGCDATRAKQCQQWLDHNIRSIAALPIMLDDKTLLGAVVLRKASAYYFTAERLDLAERALRLALPYFRHVQETENRNAWDAAVMHEVRAGLTQVFNKIDPGNGEARETKREYLNLALTDLHDLTNTFLELLQQGDGRSVPVRSYVEVQGPWTAVQRYGEYRTWGEERDFDLSPPTASSEATELDGLVPRIRHWFDRVARILIDNAFRYGTGGPVHCALAVENGNLRMTVRNRGAFSNAVLKHEFRGFNQRADLADKAMRAHLGFAIVQRLCQEVGAPPPQFCNRDEGRTVMAVAMVKWPLSQEQPTQ